jgi:aspartyl-tRNA(Asn)/glutamyl-tRNA(Gln) amidotransferase subunit A
MPGALSKMNSAAQSKLLFLTIEKAARLLRRKEISPVELVDAALAQIELLNPTLNAFITVVAERARGEALTAERDISHGKWRGPLHGIPMALKDNIWTRGIRTTAGSKILADFVPNADSDVAARLARAGVILVGKTNLHEFAYGVTTDNPHFGPARNPWNRGRITGGSSGGSAAAVASGMCFASVGTDTGGSIRIPAALCGVVGLKPTFGLISMGGIVPLAKSLDHAGPITRSPSDACIVLEAIAGNSPNGAQRFDYRKRARSLPKRFRLGWCEHYFFDRVDGEVRQVMEEAARVFSSLGGRIEKIAMPQLGEALLPATNDIALAEATHYHQSQGYFPMRAADYGEDVRHRLELGSQVLAVDYLRGRAKKCEVEKDFKAAFKQVDTILAPAAPIAAPRLGQHEVEIESEGETVRSALVRMNRPANFTGHPAISVPCGFTRDGLPIGLQLIGPRWSEARLLEIALAYEKATEWHERRPPLL